MECLGFSLTPLYPLLSHKAFKSLNVYTGGRGTTSPSQFCYPCAAPPSAPSSCAVLLRCMGGFGGGAGVSLCRRSRVLCGGCGGVLGGHFLQQPAPILGGCGLLLKGLKLFLGQRDTVGQQLLKKPHALAKAVRPVLALLLFLLLHKPLFLTI